MRFRCISFINETENILYLLLKMLKLLWSKAHKLFIWNVCYLKIITMISLIYYCWLWMSFQASRGLYMEITKLLSPPEKTKRKCCVQELYFTSLKWFYPDYLTEENRYKGNSTKNNDTNICGSALIGHICSIFRNILFFKIKTSKIRCF